MSQAKLYSAPGRTAKGFEHPKIKTVRRRKRRTPLIPLDMPSNPQKTSPRASNHPSLFDHSGHEGPSWDWQACGHCHSQGWTTPPEWLLAWTHPLYPDMTAVEDHLREQKVPVDFQSLPVRQRCTWCNGHGRRYVDPTMSRASNSR